MPAPLDPAPLDVEIWHGVMGVGMAVMLLSPVSVGTSRASLVVFAGGVAWCAFRVVRRGLRAAYLRLGLCCGAMVAMLVPAATATSRSVGAMNTMPGMPGMPGMAGMSGMSGMSGVSGMRGGAVPLWLVLVLLVAMVGVAIAGARRLATPPRARPGPVTMHRAQSAGEMVMASAMACMLAALV